MLKIMTPSTAQIKVKDLDHCGIIAGIIDEIGLVTQIDKAISQHGNQKVTTGQAVKAMILNSLGMISSPLYLFEKFFQGKATEHLLGEGILPEHLNDDCLGRALDKLYQAGVTKVFVTVALTAAKKMGVEVKSLHLDLFVADAALYSAENIQQIESLRWLSRVPATIKQATMLLTHDHKMFVQSKIDGYLIAECVRPGVCFRLASFK